MRMALSCSHQFFWAFAGSFGAVAAKEGAVIEEELQQVEVGRAQLTAEGKIVAQPRVEVFDERTGALECVSSPRPRRRRRAGISRQASCAISSLPALPVGV